MSAVLMDAPVRDLASPEETAKRHARMAHNARLTQERMCALSDAREVIRKYGVRTNVELLELLQTVHAAIARPICDSLLEDFAGRLLEMATDLDGELNATAPELDGFGQRRFA